MLKSVLCNLSCVTSKNISHWLSLKLVQVGKPPPKHVYLVVHVTFLGESLSLAHRIYPELCIAGKGA